MDQAEKLREMIRQQNQAKAPNTRIITVTSGKGGVGKSSVAINLALKFRKEGKRVMSNNVTTNKIIEVNAIIKGFLKKGIIFLLSLFTAV